MPMGKVKDRDGIYRRARLGEHALNVWFVAASNVHCCRVYCTGDEAEPCRAERRRSTRPIAFMLFRASLSYIIESGSPLRMCASRLMVPAPRRTGHLFAVLDSEESAQMI
jgi:hypothetical protein